MHSVSLIEVLEDMDHLCSSSSGMWYIRLLSFTTAVELAKLQNHTFIDPAV